MSDDMKQAVDPELKAALDSFPGFNITADILPMLRQFPAKPALSSPPYEEIFIPGSGDDAPLRCLIIDPIADADKRPAMVYYHGGGFVFGSPEITLPTMQRLAHDVGCVIILLDYRLAPERPFPAALEDGQRVLSWLASNMDRLRLDRNRIAIGGDSAGGGHAVVLTAAIKQGHAVQPSSLFLVYPMLDNDTGAEGDGGTSIWTPENNRFGWNAYLGAGEVASKIKQGAVPAKIDDLQDFPQTYLATGTLDLFYAENLAFTEKLQSQGVDVDPHVFEGAYHGFDVLVPEAKISQRFHASCVEALKGHFSPKIS